MGGGVSQLASPRLLAFFPDQWSRHVCFVSWFHLILNSTVPLHSFTYPRGHMRQCVIVMQNNNNKKIRKSRFASVATSLYQALSESVIHPRIMTFKLIIVISLSTAQWCYLDLRVPYLNKRIWILQRNKLLIPWLFTWIIGRIFLIWNLFQQYVYFISYQSGRSALYAAIVNQELCHVLCDEAKSHLCHFLYSS